MKYQGKITDPKDLVTKEYVDTGLSGKLGTSGDGSNVTAAFNAASSRTNISTGEKLTVIFGKIAKWFADLGAAAFRGVDSVPTANSTNLVESGGVKSALTQVETDLASIHATGSTNSTGATIDRFRYFYLNGVLVRAKTGIAVNATFTSGTNYETVTAGGLNTVGQKKVFARTISDGSKAYVAILNELYSQYDVDDTERIKFLNVHYIDGTLTAVRQNRLTSGDMEFSRLNGNTMVYFSIRREQSRFRQYTPPYTTAVDKSNEVPIAGWIFELTD